MEVINTTGCCDKFDPTPYDSKVIEWDNKLFIKRKIFSIFYMPVNFGSVISSMFGLIKKLNADTGEKLALSDHTSMWNMDIYLPVSKEIEGEENIKLSGKFFANAYEGEYKNMRKWVEDFYGRASEKSLKIGIKYFWYTTCPKCVKVYGKNYTVIFGKIEQ